MIAGKNLLFDEDGTCLITEKSDSFKYSQAINAPRCEVKLGNESSDPIFLLLTSNNNQTAFFTIYKNPSVQSNENSTQPNENSSEPNFKIIIRTNNSKIYKFVTNWRNENQTILFIHVQGTDKNNYIAVGIGIVVLFLIGTAGIACLYWFMQRRKSRKNHHTQLNHYCQYQVKDLQYENHVSNKANEVFNFKHSI